MRSITLSWAVCLALASMSAAQVAAQTAGASGGITGDSVPGTAFVATPADAATLDSYRGGSEVVQNDMTLSGTTAGNAAHHIETGSNTISSGSFANMNGLPVVIQNSGANVLIQNATILHLQLN